MTVTPSKDPSHHQTSTACVQTAAAAWNCDASKSVAPFGPRSLLAISCWRLVVHSKVGVMMVVFRSWSLAVQILVREQLETLCEGVEVPNRQQTRYFGNHAVTQLLWSRERDKRETWDSSDLLCAELSTKGGRASARAEETTSPPRWKRFQAEEIKELVMEWNIPVCGLDGKAKVKEALVQDLLRWCERQPEMGALPLGEEAGDVPVDATIGSAQSRVNSWRRRSRRR